MKKRVDRRSSLRYFVPKQHRGELLVSNIVFIVLNLLFLTILILFVAQQGDGAIVLEQSYAKQIALLIDAAQPETTMVLDMRKVVEKADEEGVADIVTKKDNVITVKSTEKSGYSYSYFNNVEVNTYFDQGDKNKLIIVVGAYE